MTRFHCQKCDAWWQAPPCRACAKFVHNASKKPKKYRNPYVLYLDARAQTLRLTRTPGPIAHLLARRGNTIVGQAVIPYSDSRFMQVPIKKDIVELQPKRGDR